MLRVVEFDPKGKSRLLWGDLCDEKGVEKRKKPGQLLAVTRSAPSSSLFRARFCRNPANQV